MPNKRSFNVELLNSILISAFNFTDFESESLTRDLNSTLRVKTPDSNLGVITPEWINNIPLMITSILCANGFNMSPELMGGTLGFNDDDWSKIVKYTFQNSAIIRKDNLATLKNWRYFTKTIIDMCTDMCKVDDLSIFEEQMFGKHFKPDVSGEFKRFIGQLIKDKNDKEAEAVHLMLKYAHTVSATDKNGMSSSDVALMLSVSIFEGLQINGILDSENDELIDTGIFGDENYAKQLHAFKLGLSYVFEDSFFSMPYSKGLYNGFFQEYPLDLVLDTNDSKVEEKRASKEKEKQCKKEKKHKSAADKHNVPILQFSVLSMSSSGKSPKLHSSTRSSSFTSSDSHTNNSYSHSQSSPNRLVVPNYNRTTTAHSLTLSDSTTHNTAKFDDNITRSSSTETTTKPTKKK